MARAVDRVIPAQSLYRTRSGVGIHGSAAPAVSAAHPAAGSEAIDEESSA